MTYRCHVVLDIIYTEREQNEDRTADRNSRKKGCEVKELKDYQEGRA